MISISETFFNSKINDSDVCIQGFSHDVFCKDHPDDTSRGGGCMFILQRELANYQGKNLEILDEN